MHPGALAVVVLALVAGNPRATSARAEESPLVRVEASRVSMGCVYSIVAYGASGGGIRATLEEALDEVDRIDRLASNYKPDSELSRVNGSAARGGVSVDRELFDLVAEAMTYSDESGGAFDVTVGPLVKAWGFFDDDGHVPRATDLRRARNLVGYRRVLLDSAHRTIRFDRPGVEIDLGAIAKGYAVDRVVHLLTGRGIAAALVSAGGSTVYGLGAPPGAPAWDVAVQEPRDRRKTALTVPLKDRSLSVSGSSERFFEADGVRYSHILDPRTGRPVQDVLSVAVIGVSGIVTDALGTAMFVEAHRRRALLDRHPGTEAFVFLPGAGTSFETVHLPVAGQPHVGQEPPRRASQR